MIMAVSVNMLWLLSSWRTSSFSLCSLLKKAISYHPGSPHLPYGYVWNRSLYAWYVFEYWKERVLSQSLTILDIVIENYMLTNFILPSKKTYVEFFLFLGLPNLRAYRKWYMQVYGIWVGLEILEVWYGDGCNRFRYFVYFFSLTLLMWSSLHWGNVIVVDGDK